jgi:hypothetical protein
MKRMWEDRIGIPPRVNRVWFIAYFTSTWPPFFVKNSENDFFHII